jgi:hypothetical protein
MKSIVALCALFAAGSYAHAQSWNTPTTVRQDGNTTTFKSTTYQGTSPRGTTTTTSITSTVDSSNPRQTVTTTQIHRSNSIYDPTGNGFHQ